MKFSITHFFSKCDQIRSFLRIWSYLLKRSVMENFIFCAVLGHCCLHESQAKKNKKAKCFNPKIPEKFRSQTCRLLINDKSIYGRYWSMIAFVLVLMTSLVKVT